MTTESNESYDEQVARGIALLDEKIGPNWVESINLDELELSNCVSCVLGQLFDSASDLVTLVEGDEVNYDAGLRYLDLDWAGDGPGSAAHYGFSAGEEILQSWSQLGDAWRKALTVRRGAR